MKDSTYQHHVRAVKNVVWTVMVVVCMVGLLLVIIGSRAFTSKSPEFAEDDKFDD